MPLVSVIVPNFNHSYYLQQRIDSILNQTFQDFELILLDDCSSDNSREILESYRNHPNVTQLIYNKTNSGSTFRQWDKGIELAKGEYIWIAESDDVAEPNFLQTITEQIANNFDTGLLYTSSRLIDSSGNTTFPYELGDTGDVNHYNGQDFIKQKLSSSNAIWNVSMVVFLKSFYTNIDTSLFINMKYCGDWYLYALLAEQAPVIEIKKVLNNFRIHDGNVSKAAERSGKSFTEGLVVYDYVKKYFTTAERLKYDFEWAKYLHKSQRKYQLNTDVFQMVIKEIQKSNKRIICLYHLYNLIKSYK